jgi:hypothetical protein
MTARTTVDGREVVFSDGWVFADTGEAVPPGSTIEDEVVDNVGRLRDRLSLNILGGFGLLDLLGYIRNVDIDRLKDAPDLKDADDIQDWFEAVEEAVEAIPSDAPNVKKIKIGADILGRMIQSDMFDELHEFLGGLFDMAFGDDDDDEVTDGLVGGRRRDFRKELGLGRLEVARAVMGLRQDPGFSELPDRVQREMILTRATGRTISELQDQVGEGRDWAAFFESFGDFLIKIQPFIEMIIKLFGGAMLVI